MTIPKNKYPVNECVFLDANALIFSGDNNIGFKESCNEVLVNLRKKNNRLVITHSMRYELLCKAASIDRYIKRDRELYSDTDHYKVSDEIVVAATKLHFLYGQNMDTKQYAQRPNNFRDLLIACSAGKHQIETGTRTTVLSGDHDFKMPYIHPVSIFPLSHPNQPTKCMNLYLYEIQVNDINSAWQKQLDNCNGLQQDNNDA